MNQLPDSVLFSDQKSIGAQHDGMPASDNVGGEKDGVCCQGRIPRLSQIRRQARSKNHFLVQHNNGQYTRDHLQGRMPRLTQIRHQARCRNHLLVQDRIGENTGRHSQGKSIRLSHVRCQARSKHKLVLQESMGFGEITLGHTQGRITHLSRVQHQARARSNLFVQEGVGELVQRHSDCHTSGGTFIGMFIEGKKKGCGCGGWGGMLIISMSHHRV